MSLFEITLENPAYKRVTENETGAHEDATLEATEAKGEATPEAEAELEAEPGGSKRRPALGALVVLAAAATALAVKRRRA